MNTVGIGTAAAFANLVTPFSPVGKQAVGLENAEAKEDALAPVEESEKNAGVLNRNNEEFEKPALLGKDADSESADDSQKNKEEAREASNQERLNEKEKTLQDQAIITKLASRDREVRAHEQAHAAVGGQFAGAPSFTFQRGPDGINYAVGGEVPISLPSGSGDNPQATLSAADQVRRAALAPADPSAQDFRIASKAGQIAVEARADIVKLEAEQRQEQADEKKDEQQKVDEEKRIEDKNEAIKEDEAKALQEEARKQQQALAENRRRALEFSDQLVKFNQVDGETVVGAFLDQKV